MKQWAGFGFFAMSIDYRLVGCTPAPACYQDMQCAIRFLHAHADKYNIDPKRVFLIGQSAGGHLVSLAATLGDGPFPRTGGWEKARNDVRAVISVAAPYELTALSWGNIWTPLGVDPVKARKLASPVQNLSKNMRPLLILHSDNDQSVPIDNALLMVDAVRKADVPYQFQRYPKMGHMGINDEVIKQSLAFIKKQSEQKSRHQGLGGGLGQRQLPDDLQQTSSPLERYRNLGFPPKEENFAKGWEDRVNQEQRAWRPRFEAQLPLRQRPGQAPSRSSRQRTSTAISCSKSCCGT